MPNGGRRGGLTLWRAGLAWGWLAIGPAMAQEQAPVELPAMIPTSVVVPSPQGVPSAGPSIDELVRMSPEQLDGLYDRGWAGAIPEGKVRGRAIVFPGTRMARPASKAARALWQGKVFLGDEAAAVNKFFGLRAVRADVSLGPSWRDGRPSIILDYSDTSLVYARYRDEIREVAPGLYLGLMYARTCPQPKLKMYFALQAQPARH